MTQTTNFASFLVRSLLNIHKTIANLSEQRIVSKPQTTSRLRYVNIIKPVDETPYELAYRTQYVALQNWNDDYWTRNNDLFNKEKSEYINQNFGDRISAEEALSHDLLAPFYRSFLEKNMQRQIDYNKIWYRKLSLLLISAILAKVSRVKLTLVHTKLSR